jgi:hypothetical protein
MSIISRILSAKKAAEEHKEVSKATATLQQHLQKPYKHVPTHAAIDALSGAPSSWREEDRAAIRAANLHRLSMSRNNKDLLSASYARPSIRTNSGFAGSEHPSSGRLHPIVEGKVFHPGFPAYDAAEIRCSKRTSKHVAKSPLSSTRE